MAKVLIIFGVLTVLLGGSCAMTVMGINNNCVRQENDINAQYDGNRVRLAGYTNKILDMVQVPKMAKNHIIEVATAAIQGRYGKDGAKAVFQAVHEQNPNVDPGLYRTLMQAMESGRNEFDADQRTLLDKCRVYRSYYQSAPQSFLVGFVGFPKLDQSKCTPVTTDSVEHDFKAKRTGPLQLE